MENSWDWCPRELWCCQGINSDLKIQNGSQELSEDAHSPTPVVVDFRLCNAPLLNLKFRLIFPRSPWLPCLAVAQPGPPWAGGPASFWPLKSWTTETCFQSTLSFPPLLLSLEDLLFCEICESREIYSAFRLNKLSGEQKTKATLDLDRGTRIEIPEHLIPWDRLQPPH